MRICLLLFFVTLSCISFEEDAISSSPKSQNTCQGTAQALIDIANALPKGASIRLPITIQKINPLGGLSAALGDQPLELFDMTSMGLSGFGQVKEGQTVWMDGQWGAIIELPTSDDSKSKGFSVVAVGDIVPSNTPLTIIRLDGNLDCTKP